MICWPVLRLLLSLGLGALAAWVIVPAPTVPLFRLALVATEFGHWLFLLSLLLALTPGPHTGVGHAGTALALIAGALFLSPLLRASLLAPRLPREMAQAFPQASVKGEPPLVWHRVWWPPGDEPGPVATREFARHEDQPLHLQIYRSPEHRPAPCVVVIHGGGWESGSAAEFPALNQHLARRGYAVAAIEYRLAPRWPWPAQREDTLDALRWLKSHAEEFGIDAQRFVLLGRSAGGQIAEAVTYGAHDPAIRGCIAFYAPADLHFAHEFARADDILNSLQLVRQYMNGTPAEARPSYDSASGILLAEASSPPTLLLHGSRDELVWFRQSERLAARLRALGAPHYFLQLPWATHAFDYNLHGPGGQISTYAVEHFLTAVTR
jgi:acetyl esterase/lipase